MRGVEGGQKRLERKKGKASELKRVNLRGIIKEEKRPNKSRQGFRSKRNKIQGGGASKKESVQKIVKKDLVQLWKKTRRERGMGWSTRENSRKEQTEEKFRLKRG